VGWAGPGLQPGQAVPGPAPGCPGPVLHQDQVCPVFLSDTQHERAYSGHCKAGLWPLFHSAADRAVFDEEDWAAYREVNTIFADAVLVALRAAFERDSQDVPVVWIHDYHLMCVPGLVRRMAEEAGLPCRIGYFLHIPFPPWDLLRIHPWKDIFLQGMLGSDLIGFQCSDYLLNFLDCCERGLRTRVDRQLGLVDHGAGGQTGLGRQVRVRSLPLGVPYSEFGRLAREAPPSQLPVPPAAQVVLSVDTLDFTKGLQHRVAAWERLLDRYHIHRGAATLVQVCLPSRSPGGQQVRDQLEKSVEQLNRQFGQPGWTPVLLLTAPLEDSQLAGLYRDADLALVTPLRDGMNLTGKEFVACRVDAARPGVLLLSPFTGAADTMPEALIVNPYEAGRVADYLHHALTMSTAEAEVRMTALRARAAGCELDIWVERFCAELQGESGEVSRQDSMQEIKLADFDTILGGYLGQAGNTARLCLLLDYDGTLAPHGSHPDLTVLPPPTQVGLSTALGSTAAPAGGAGQARGVAGAVCGRHHRPLHPRHQGQGWDQERHLRWQPRP